MINFGNEILVEAKVNNGQGYINMLMYDKKITLWNLKTENNIITFYIKPSDYRTVSQTVRRYGGKTKVLKRQGLYFWLRKYRYRYGSFFGILSFSFIIVFLSGFVLDIKITGNEAVSNNQILEHLDSIGITTGIPVKSINKTHSEISLLLGLNKLAWVSVEQVGSRLNVKVAEREESGQNIALDIPCNIVANRTGRIVETEVYRGRLERPVGSGVAKGEMIVSGTIDDGNGRIIYSHADAKIIAECEEFVSFYSQYKCIEKKKTSNKTKKDYLQFLGQSYPLFINPKTPKNAAYHEEMRHPDIMGLKLPLRIKTAVYTAYNEIEVTYSDSEVLAKLNNMIDNYQNNFYGDAEIVKWDTEYLPDENGIRVNINIIYRIDIAQKSEIYAHG